MSNLFKYKNVTINFDNVNIVKAVDGYDAVYCNACLFHVPSKHNFKEAFEKYNNPIIILKIPTPAGMPTPN